MLSVDELQAIDDFMTAVQQNGKAIIKAEPPGLKWHRLYKKGTQETVGAVASLTVSYTVGDHKIILNCDVTHIDAVEPVTA